YRIELGEIEATLKSHAGVREAVVIAREDVPGDKRVTAYVVADTGRELRVPELRGHLEDALPEYMIPSAFVVMEQLPLLPNGKVDRRSLPAPGDGRAGSDAAAVAPRDHLEARLVEIWESVLRLSSIGIRDNFFSLGGNS